MNQKEGKLDGRRGEKFPGTETSRKHFSNEFTFSTGVITLLQVGGKTPRRNSAEVSTGQKRTINRRDLQSKLRKPMHDHDRTRGAHERCRKE